jgi:hypothetical protein
VRRCVYDNLTAAVRKLVGARRELTGRFLALVGHYLFEPDFARIGEGHDKDHASYCISLRTCGASLG